MHTEEDDREEPAQEIHARDKSELLIQTIISILLNFMLGYFFYQFSSKEEHYGNPEECQKLRFWGYWFAIYGFAIVIARIFINVPLLLTRKPDNNIKSLMQLTNATEAILSITFLVIITLVVFLGEPCAELRVLAKIYLTSAYCVLLLIICCVACTIAGQGSQATGHD